MARLPRFDISDQPQHAIQRGNLRSITLKKLKDAFQKFQCNFTCSCFNDQPCAFIADAAFEGWNWQGNTNVEGVIGGLRKSRKNQSSLTTMMHDPNDAQ